MRLASDREQPIRERDQSMNSKTILSADNKCGANCVQFDIKFKIDFKSSGVIENEHKAVKILTTFKITFFWFQTFPRHNKPGWMRERI